MHILGLIVIAAIVLGTVAAVFIAVYTFVTDLAHEREMNAHYLARTSNIYSAGVPKGHIPHF